MAFATYVCSFITLHTSQCFLNNYFNIRFITSIIVISRPLIMSHTSGCLSKILLFICNIGLLNYFCSFYFFYLILFLSHYSLLILRPPAPRFSGYYFSYHVLFTLFFFNTPIDFPNFCSVSFLSEFISLNSTYPLFSSHSRLFFRLNFISIIFFIPCSTSIPASISFFHYPPSRLIERLFDFPRLYSIFSLTPQFVSLSSKPDL